MSPPLHPSARRPMGASGYSTALVASVLDGALAKPGCVYAIAGLQGTGKTTLSAQVVAAAKIRGLRAVALSIDDFYLGRRERQRLGRHVHPLLATRGPPGTHDVALACDVLDSLREGRATRLPRFDKIADRRLPPSRWPLHHGMDLVVFEGWCLNVPPQDAGALVMPINPLERDEDPAGTWRHYCNRALAEQYPALWSRLPRLLFLQGPGFEVVANWRWQQEQSLQAAYPRRNTMSQAQVQRFIQLFERVSRQALHTLPAIAARTILLDARRRPMPADDAVSKTINTSSAGRRTAY